MLSELCGMGKIRDTEKVWIAPDEIVNWVKKLQCIFNCCQHCKHSSV